MIGFIIDFLKELFKVLWDLFKEVVSFIFKELWILVIAIAAAGLLWYLGGGYDKAEQDYLAQQKKKEEAAQVLQELERQKQQNPDQGVYIVR